MRKLRNMERITEVENLGKLIKYKKLGKIEKNWCFKTIPKNK